MDNPTTLLVAIMYVTIIATGLMTVLMTLSDIVGKKRHDDPVNYITYLTAGTGVLFFTLMFSKNYRVHVGGVILLGLVIVSRLVVQAI